MAFSDADPDISIVKETPNMDGIGSVYSPGSLNKNENSGSTSISIEASSHELSFQSVPLTNSSRASPKAQCSLVATPKKNVTLNMHSSILETESSLNLSVNSHTQKRRKSMYSPLVNFVNGQSDTPDSETPDSTSSVNYSMASRDANRKIEFGVETNGSEHKSKSNVPHVLTTNNCVASSMSVGCVMDKRLQISCSLCKTPLGLPENQLHLACSVSSSSKCHLESLRTNVLKFHTGNTSSSGIPVIITDSASVDQRLLNSEGATGQGIWCEEDGCVFSTIFCPFCRSHNNCLGVQVMAANRSNVHLLNKVGFYLIFIGYWITFRYRI